MVNATRPLAPTERTAFLNALETHFAGRTDVGDGELRPASFEICETKALPLDLPT